MIALMIRSNVNPYVELRLLNILTTEIMKTFENEIYCVCVMSLWYYNEAVDGDFLLLSLLY